MENTKMSISRVGFYSAIFTSLFTAIALVVGAMTPPISGPFCESDCISYPYTYVAAFVPGDYLWMYPALLSVLVFVVLMVCIHNAAAAEKRLFSLVAVCFAIMSSTILGADYFIQLAVIQPSLLKGETEGLSLISQYNPHGIFIALEDLGYLMMSVASLFAAFVFTGQNKVERAIRWLFITSFVLVVGLLLVLSLFYGEHLEYRFEVAVILINWTVLIVAGILLSVYFSRYGQERL